MRLFRFDMERKGYPKLIITADDYGMSQQFNDGILEVARAGLITGISIMITRQYIKPTELLSLRIPLGLHLELENSSPYTETLSQVTQFQERFGKPPTYLDGHQHKHIATDNIQKVIFIAQRFNIPVRSRFLEDRTLFRQSGLKTPDDFISWHPSRTGVLLEKLSVKESSTLEMVCHPGYIDNKCSYPYNHERFAELQFMKSQNFRDALRSFTLVGYNTL